MQHDMRIKDGEDADRLERINKQKMETELCRDAVCTLLPGAESMLRSRQV